MTSTLLNSCTAYLKRAFNSTDSNGNHEQLAKIAPFLITVSLVGATLLSRLLFSSKHQRSGTKGGLKIVGPTNVVSANQLLLCHSAEFSKKEVIKVAEGVWVAIGFGLANSIMIEGESGVIIVDCMESDDNAKVVMKNFRKLCNKPVVAIIYTHNHADHVQGTRSFLEYAANKNCDVYAHVNTAAIMKTFLTKTGPIGFKRAGRQFGQFLPENQHINCGIGPCLGYSQDTILDLVLPTKTFTDHLKITISGVQLELHHAPGETDDQIVVYLPEKLVLCAADNVYKSFPNLYAIRGTPTRDAYQWANTIEYMRSFQSSFLVPSHTRPVIGREAINDLLVVYRDAILFVHDQTVRLMNSGMFVDDIASRLRNALPSHLASHPHLQQHYGTVEWGVRGVFNQYIGWFGGDPAHLHPLSPPEHASRMVQLAGGTTALLASADEALAKADPQWALLCAQAVMRHLTATAKAAVTTDTDNIDDTGLQQAQEQEVQTVVRGSDEYQSAQSIAVSSLEMLAEREISANGRNYYLTYALELAGRLSLTPSATQIKHVTKAIGAVDIIRMLPTRIIPQKCLTVKSSIVYKFPDLHQAISLQINCGVARAIDMTQFVYESANLSGTGNIDKEQLLLDMFDLVITVDSKVFLDVAAKEKSSAMAVLSGEMNVVGKGLLSSLSLKKFMEYFEDASVEPVVPV